METTETDFGPDLYAGFLADFMRRHADQPFGILSNELGS